MCEPGKLLPEELEMRHQVWKGRWNCSFYQSSLHFHRKWIWEPPQLPWAAGVSGWYEQEHAGEIPATHELRHEQPQTWPPRAHPPWCQEQHALHREYSHAPSHSHLLPPSTSSPSMQGEVLLVSFCVLSCRLCSFISDLGSMMFCFRGSLQVFDT